MIHFHKYKNVRNTGKHKYQQCIKCEKRKIIITTSVGDYQPIDREWINK